mmetsp:Transcript_35994/g.70742  ORF Transcript_35994/g.70742 Transcript_35994/m.70742 type:complete len:127 (-) Transcript_35994:219-599(-)
MPRSDYNTQYTIRRNMEEHYKRLRNIRPNVDHRNEYQYRLAKDRHKRKLRNRLVNEQMRINRENDVLCKKLIAVHTSGHTGSHLRLKSIGNRTSQPDNQNQSTNTSTSEARSKQIRTDEPTKYQKK